MADIFISYAQEDGASIEPLVKLLESQGWTVFWDRKLMPGENFTTLIEKKLSAAKAAIVVWSSHSTASEWVKAEAMAARERGILIPVRIDQCAIPLPFGLVQTADISPDTADAADSYGKLIQQVSSFLAKAPSNPELVTHFSSARTSVLSGTNWRHVLFEIDGRLSRRIFWLGLLILLPVFAALQFVIEAVVRATNQGATEAAIMEKSAIAYLLFTLYPTIAITVKRLHDFNFSGWWALPPMVVYVFLTAPQATLLSDPSNMEAVQVGLLYTAIMIVPFLIIGLIPGNRGPNRFGMPLQ